MFEIFYLGSIFTAFATIYLLLFKENAIRSYADYLLSFYFIFIIWTAVLYLILNNGQIINYPYLYKTAAPINFIIIPIGYLYVRSILYNEKRFTIKDIWHFIPFFLMVISTYLQKMNSIYFIYKNQWLVVLRITSIGVLRSSVPAPRGPRISTVALRSAA